MAEQKTPSVEDQLKQLREQMQALTSANEQLQRTNMQLMSQPPQQVQQQQTHQTTPRDVANLDIDLNNMPDPVTQPREYAQEVARRTQRLFDARLQAFQHEQQRTSTAQSRSAGLWNDFQRRFPQYKDKDDQIGYVLNRVKARADAIGVDADRYMYGPGREQFFRDVDEEYKKVFGEAKVEGEGEKKEQQQKALPNDPDAQRTAVFAGVDGNVRTAPDPTDPNDKPVDMTEQLLAAQKGTGYM